MKPHIFSASSLLCAAAIVAAEEASKPVMRDAATHDKLVRAMRYSEQNDPMKGMTLATGEDPSKVNQPVDILEQSDIISYNGLATLVPKRAILAIPTNHRDRLGIKPGDRFVGWSEFHALNRGWISTVEVSRAQAEGNQLIAEEKRDHIAKSRNLVVATCLGGPISVLPPKADAKIADNAESETSKP